MTESLVLIVFRFLSWLSRKEDGTKADGTELKRKRNIEKGDIEKKKNKGGKKENGKVWIQTDFPHFYLAVNLHFI